MKLVSFGEDISADLSGPEMRGAWVADWETPPSMANWFEAKAEFTGRKR